MTTRNPDAGFTLIEALVAMAVFALGAVSLLSATEGHAARITSVTDRIAARWAADNALITSRLGLPVDNAVTIMGRDYTVAVTMAATDDPDLVSLNVTVAALTGDRDSNTIYRLSGYRFSGVGSGEVE